MSELSIADHQRSLNERNREAWAAFANHREEIARLTIAAAGSVQALAEKPTLCVLGAGNGNDLDLAVLADTFAAIDLVDLDGGALQRIKDRYADQPNVLKNVRCVAGVDVSGVAAVLPQLKQDPTEALTKSVYDQAVASECSLDGTYDVVVSTGLLTQLIDAVVQTLGRESSLVIPLTIAVRDGHLNLMARLRKAGGRTVLVSDFVSSDTLPELKAAQDADAVLKLSRRAIEQRNFFTGANPFSIREKLVTLKQAASHEAVEIAAPWRWQIGTRFYLVTALSY